MQTRDRTTAFLLLTATAALALALTAFPAAAQDSGTDSGTVRSAPGSEAVIVNAPRYVVERDPFRGNITRVSESRNVRADDLDLSSPLGRDMLRVRIRDAAAGECADLTRAYSVGVGGSPPCYEQAVAGGIHQADAAFRNAGYESISWY